MHANEYRPLCLSYQRANADRTRFSIKPSVQDELFQAFEPKMRARTATCATVQLARVNIALDVAAGAPQKTVLARTRAMATENRSVLKYDNILMTYAVKSRFSIGHGSRTTV